jgi:hypothetical protein
VANRTVPIQEAGYCTDQVDRFRKALPTVFLFSVAAADSRRLTRSLALSARPKARTVR